MEKNKYDFLIVYNTCGIRSDQTAQYIRSLQSIRASKTDFKFKLVMSSCLNQQPCRQVINEIFADDVSIIPIDHPYTVNITYNISCQLMINEYGAFKGYLYIDSGVDFLDNEDALDKLFSSFIDNNYGILSAQVNEDHGLHHSKGGSFPIVDVNYIMPLGGSVNGHVDLFSHDIYERYEKVWPDVFKAHCTESTFSFIAASVNKKQAVLKDVILTHRVAVDGASLSSPRWSPENGNTWNNLLFNRDVNDFINDSKAIKSGLGYEECQSIMMHSSEAYDNNQQSLYPEELANCIEKYFYTTSDEINYKQICLDMQQVKTI
jgi:hypothetical protein